VSSQVSRALEVEPELLQRLQLALLVLLGLEDHCSLPQALLVLVLVGKPVREPLRSAQLQLQMPLPLMLFVLLLLLLLVVVVVVVVLLQLLHSTGAEP
jgi:hypothetical protein